jgi:hypothetical protein
VREREKKRKIQKRKFPSGNKYKLPNFPQEINSLLAINQIGPLLDR